MGDRKQTVALLPVNANLFRKQLMLQLCSISACCTAVTFSECESILSFHLSTLFAHCLKCTVIFKHFDLQIHPLINQSLEFVMGTRILAEMKIENLGKKIFFHGKTNWQAYFFLKRSVGVAEGMEITPWTNASLPAKSIVDGVIVRGHLHISSYFRDKSIRPVLIGQKSLLNQWTSTLHSKLNRS